MYSGPSLSGRSQKRPPSLTRPQLFAAIIINVFTFPSPQRPPLQCGHNFLANRVALLEKDYCMCQFTMIFCALITQNGSILDGLLLWKQNVDKKFEGLEECMICFAVIHGTNCQLPKLQCRTCKKKFHAACLVSCTIESVTEW